MLTVFVWYTAEPELGGDLKTDGRSFDNKLHSCIRW